MTYTGDVLRAARMALLKDAERFDEQCVMLRRETLKQEQSARECRNDAQEVAESIRRIEGDDAPIDQTEVKTERNK